MATVTTSNIVPVTSHLNRGASGSEIGRRLGQMGEDVVFICNDWHTALVPCFLKTVYKPMGIYTSGKCDEIDPADVLAISTAVRRAITSYDTSAMKEIIQNCMAQDLSWKEPSKQWEKMLLSLEVAGSESGVEGEEIAPLARENLATP